jgi:hypothetical protein
MMSMAFAPAARADDPFADIVTAVDGDLAFGQASFALAASDFSTSDVSDGLAALFVGVDDDVLSLPDNILQGPVAALTDVPVDPAISWSFAVPADGPDAFIAASTVAIVGEADLATAANDFVCRDLASGVAAGLLGEEYIDVFAQELVIVGAAQSFGL